MEASPQQPDRVNLLIRMAVWVVVITMIIIIFSPRIGLDDFSKGAITLILGRFMGYVDNIYAFEFSSTRSSKRKDETIQELTTTAAVATTSAATSAAVMAAVDKAKAENVQHPMPTHVADATIVAEGEVTVQPDNPKSEKDRP